MNNPCPKCGKERGMAIGDFTPSYFCQCPTVTISTPNNNYYYISAVCPQCANKDTTIDMIRKALDELSRDMHNVSKRPCDTCKTISNLLGKPFGCYKFQGRMP